MAHGSSIADARELLTGSGPGFVPGKSEIRNGDQLILSGDMVAVDSCCARLMERADPSRQLTYARAIGLGGTEDVEVVRVSG